MAEGGGPAFWNGRPVLVTGASGLIGSWLVKDLLDLGARVAVLLRDQDPQSELIRSGDLRRCSVVQGNLEDFWALERAVSLHEVDTVFHLGAQTLVGVAHRLPLSTFEANIRGTYNLLEVCRQHAGLVKRLIVASSDKAYGHSETLPYKEDTPLLGRHPYEVSKTCADLLAQSFHHTYGLPVAVVRCGNVFGGGDLNYSRIVPGTIRSLLEGQRPQIRSDGTYVRDYIYVRDVSRAYLALAERLLPRDLAGQAFNFSLERPITVLDLVNIIAQAMGREDLKPHIVNTARGEIVNQYLDASKARIMLGWKPEFGLEEGLAETIAWYRGHLAPKGESGK